ncbi:MAG: hypothetical protein SFV81_20225 [Pirellulaceae bacterium]|nr:hypothetical protein [Pirellulaceae bacterium]
MKRELCDIEYEAKTAAIRIYLAGLLEVVGEANDAGLIRDTRDLGSIGRAMQDFAASIDGGDEEPYMYEHGNAQLLSMLGYE